MADEGEEQFYAVRPRWPSLAGERAQGARPRRGRRGELCSYYQKNHQKLNLNRFFKKTFWKGLAGR